MRAGDLKERFRFERRRDLSTDLPPGDGLGTYEGDWVPRFTCSAKLHFMRGGEDVLAARLAGSQLAVLIVRACFDAREVKTDWRCVDTRSGDAYNIRSISPAPNGSSIDFLIERGVNSG